jgi:hypothetical protein
MEDGDLAMDVERGHPSRRFLGISRKGLFLNRRRWGLQQAS